MSGAGMVATLGVTPSVSRKHRAPVRSARPERRWFRWARRRGRERWPADEPRLDALDGDDALDLLQRAHHVLQLREVRADEREDVDGAAVVAGAAVGLADVDALLAERLADGGEDARAGSRSSTRSCTGRLIFAFESQRDLDAALGIGVERLRAAAAVDGDAAAARDEAEDLVARQRVAALGVADEHVVDAVEADAAARRLPVTLRTSDSMRPSRSCSGGRRRRVAVLAAARGRRATSCGVDLAVADADEELVVARDLERLERPCARSSVVLQELGERDAALVQLPLEELAPELERLVALLGAEEVADLALRAPGDRRSRASPWSAAAAVAVMTSTTSPLRSL